MDWDPFSKIPNVEMFTDKEKGRPNKNGVANRPSGSPKKFPEEKAGANKIYFYEYCI